MKIKGLRWYIVTMLLLVTTINYLDRTSLSVAAPVLKGELRIDEQQFSYIIMCFQFSYLIMQPLSGRVLDWLGTKRGFSLAVVWWSIANMLHAFARTPFSFGIFRSLLAVGEAANFPGIAKTNSEWFPARERTMATGIANIGAGTGALIATPFVAWIIYKFGWQEAFVITGAIGFIWVVFWMILYKPPAQNSFITPEELTYINEGQKELQAEDTGPVKNVWKLVLGQRNFWGIALARFLSEPAWQFFSYWIPIYFVTQRGLNLKQVGLYLWMPFLAADVGSFVGGVLSPFYQKFGFKVLTARKLSMTTAACMMPFAFFVTKTESPGWAIFYICMAAFGHQCISATLLTLPVDLFPKRTVATANGLSGSAALAGGMIFTFIVGWLVMHIGYAPIFVTIAFLDLIGAALLWALIREPKAEASAAIKT
jgi:ACS family hexuronate transporter-like MFS transporter